MARREKGRRSVAREFKRRKLVGELVGELSREFGLKEGQVCVYL